MLEELQKTSEIVFESDKFAKVGELSLDLDKTESDADEAIKAILRQLSFIVLLKL